MRSEGETRRAINQYADMVRRICLLHLKNRTDTEDVFQDVFLKYAMHDAAFENPSHEKAWLIRVTLNACRDLRRSLFRHGTLPLDLLSEEAACVPPQEREVLQAVLSLPEKYKTVLYLHYYEGYSAKEIGPLVNRRENSVYSLLSRGRELLRQALGGEDVGA